MAQISAHSKPINHISVIKGAISTHRYAQRSKEADGLAVLLNNHVWLSGDGSIDGWINNG